MTTVSQRASGSGSWYRQSKHTEGIIGVKTEHRRSLLSVGPGSSGCCCSPGGRRASEDIMASPQIRGLQTDEVNSPLPLMTPLVSR